MRTSEPRLPTPARGGPARGFTYLGLLALLALIGAALASAGRSWSHEAQRVREAELLFRGGQISAAIGRYRAAQWPPEWPPSLLALQEDRRAGVPRHHLRRIWTDPFTGRADWVLLPPPEGTGVAGVRSRSARPRLLRLGAAPAPGQTPRVSDWVFVHQPAVEGANEHEGQEGTR